MEKIDSPQPPLLGKDVGGTPKTVHTITEIDS